MPFTSDGEVQLLRNGDAVRVQRDVPGHARGILRLPFKGGIRYCRKPARVVKQRVQRLPQPIQWVARSGGGCRNQVREQDRLVRSAHHLEKPRQLRQPVAQGVPRHHRGVARGLQLAEHRECLGPESRSRADQGEVTPPGISAHDRAQYRQWRSIEDPQPDPSCVNVVGDPRLVEKDTAGAVDPRLVVVDHLDTVAEVGQDSVCARTDEYRLGRRAAAHMPPSYLVESMEWVFSRGASS